MSGENQVNLLGDIIRLVRGTTYKSALLGKPGPVLLGLASIARNGGFRSDNLKTYGGESPDKLTLYPGDMYVSLKDVTQSADLLGAVARVPDSVSCGRVTQDTVKLEFTGTTIDPKYLYWVLRTPVYREYCRARAIGTTNLSLSREDFLAFPVPVAGKRELALVKVLDAIDDKIELNRKMNETLEQMARALFKSWFIDFDPVRAKMEGRQPPGMDADTAALFPSRLVESELGLVPEGWEVGSVYHIANVVYGAPFASALFNAKGDGRPLIRIRDLANEQPSTWTPESHPKGYMVQPGDVVVGMDGEFRAYLWGGVPAWLNQRLCVFKPNPGFSAAFVRNSIIAPLMEIESTETATTVIHLGKADIERFKVLIPSAEIQETITRNCQPWYDEIVLIKHQSRILASLRDTLLPQLMKGEGQISNQTS